MRPAHDLHLRPDCSIHEDHDQPALDGADVAHDVWRYVAHPGRSGDGWRWQVDRAERDDGALLAILENGEIRRREPAHRAAVAVEDGDIHLHDVDARTERLQRRGRILSGFADQSGEEKGPYGAAVVRIIERLLDLAIAAA